MVKYECDEKLLKSLLWIVYSNNNNNNKFSLKLIHAIQTNYMK